MKKSVICSLCGLLCFALVSTANASTCSNEERVHLKNVAKDIEATHVEDQDELDPSTYLTGPEEGYGPVYEDYFKIVFSNITKEVYVKVFNDYNDEVKFIRYQDTDEGVFTFDWKHTDKITKFTYEVYSSAETSCPDEKYFTDYLILPKYNDFSTKVMCEGLDDFPACQKYITSDIDPKEQERQITEFLKEKEEKEEKKNKKWNEKIGDFVSNHKVLIITGSIIVIAGVATVVVRNKRKRVK